MVVGIALGQDSTALSLKTRIALSNVDGRIDHLSADVKGQRLFMSALGNHTLEVLDVQGAKRLKTIPELPEPQGALYDPSSNHLFVANAKDGTAKVFDGTTFQLLNTAKFGEDADNVRYDARGRRIVVGYGDGALGFLDPNGNKTGEIKIEGHPESFQLEKTGTRVFVNVPGRNELVVVDLAKNAILAKWPITSAKSNYPMALDETNHRLFLGCRRPAKLLVLDTESGRQLASVDIVGDTDDLFYDAQAKRVYVIGGAGFVDVFERRDSDQYVRAAHIATAPGARTGLLVPEWRRLFVAVPHRGEQRAEVLIYEVK
jgi:DNA-binding beta-propeller fold protein YncE